MCVHLNFVAKMGEIVGLSQIVGLSRMATTSDRER